MGIPTVAIYSDPDSRALHTHLADEAYPLGGYTAKDTYLNQDKIFEVAERSGAQAIHPGYGFVSEDPFFAEACAARGFGFIGPSPQTLRLAGNKLQAKILASSLGVPVVPGNLEPWLSVREWVELSEGLGYPLYVKPATYSGGGRGIRLMHSSQDLVSALGLKFGEPLPSWTNSLFIEKVVNRAKHVEVQFLADRQGQVVVLGERECTIQRRHQKLIEESPCTTLEAEPEIRTQIFEATRALAKGSHFKGAGTAEFLLDRQGNFYFMEINARLQVEHGVTEMVTGLDLVKEQLLLAADHPLRYDTVVPRGAAIECRVYAEDPKQNFMPSPGTVTAFHEVGGFGMRVDSAIYPGMEVSPYYDSLLAKIIAWGENREEALNRMKQALKEYRLEGVQHTILYSLAVLRAADFISGKYDYTLNGNILF